MTEADVSIVELEDTPDEGLGSMDVEYASTGATVAEALQKAVDEEYDEVFDPETDMEWFDVADVEESREEFEGGKQ